MGADDFGALGGAEKGIGGKGLVGKEEKKRPCLKEKYAKETKNQQKEAKKAPYNQLRREAVVRRRRARAYYRDLVGAEPPRVGAGV